LDDGLPNSFGRFVALLYPAFNGMLALLRIPEHPPTYSDNMRPPIPGYPPTCDALP
jgi:hypothetical protein